MFKEAAREDIILESLYPFSKVQVKRDKGKRLFLNKEQLEQLKNYKIEYEGKEGYVHFFGICRWITL